MNKLFSLIIVSGLIIYLLFFFAWDIEDQVVNSKIINKSNGILTIQYKSVKADLNHAKLAEYKNTNDDLQVVYSIHKSIVGRVIKESIFIDK